MNGQAMYEVMQGQLKPCPLCGEKADLIELSIGSPYGNCNDCSGTIICDCGVEFYKEWTLKDTVDGREIIGTDIVTAWNTRAEL